MSHRTVAGIVTCGLLIGMTGCSATSALSTGGSMGLNLAKTDTHLRIWLDGQPAKQNSAKKAVTGYSDWKVKEQVSTSPKLKFEITKPEKLGRIMMVTVNIFKEFKKDYSTQAEYAVFCKDNGPEGQMKPDVEYDLGQPGDTFKVTDLTGNVVAGVKLESGVKYKLVLTVKADKSETAQIEFKTN
jgi:hypothetical protein